MSKKKDKKLNQVLQPGGEGMQYLINTLKKYQIMQQKQQQRKKQIAKYYNLQSKVFDKEDSDDSFNNNSYNKYHGLDIGNYNNQNISYKKMHTNIGNKNYIYDGRLANNENKSNEKMINDISNYNGSNMKVKYLILFQS